MTHSMALIIRRTTAILPKHCLGFTAPCILDTKVRTLYSPAALGIDNYLNQKNRCKNQFATISDKFISKMKEFTSDETKGMVFTEDLKNMIHLAETDDDIELVVKMMKRFVQQNSSMRFGSYVYGPVAMRLFYHCNKPDVALECFKDPQIGNVFNQLISYQILLDLLYNNGRYQEVLEAFEAIKERQIEGAKYPKNVVVLVYATLYKMNTKESFDYATKLYQELSDCGHNLMRRAVTYFAALAISQGQPGLALEVLVNLKNQSYVTVRNLKVSALCDVGRLEDTIPIFQNVLRNDFPESRVKQTFAVDVVKKFKVALENCDSAELKLEFKRILDILENEGHIHDETLEHHLFKDIEENRVFEQRDRVPRNIRSFDDRIQERGRTFQYSKRPGLAELN